jgi:prepilin-type N-terminal cleavage/methylation domain-containing protein
MKNGFTFIELIIATAILLSLVGFGTASYVNFNERQVLEQAARDLKNNLRVAQQNAITGVKDNALCDPDGAGPTPAETFRGWCMSPVTTSAAYQIYGVCDTNENDGTVPRTFPGNANIIPVPLSNGVTLSAKAAKSGVWGNLNDTSNTRVRFNVFGNNTQLADDTYVKVTYCLGSTFPSLGDRKYYAVTVRKSGEIIDEGFTSDCWSNAL